MSEYLCDEIILYYGPPLFLVKAEGELFPLWLGPREPGGTMWQARSIKRAGVGRNELVPRFTICFRMEVRESDQIANTTLRDSQYSLSIANAKRTSRDVRNSQAFIKREVQQQLTHR